MKSRNVVALFSLVLGFSGCSSSRPHEETPSDNNAAADKQKEAEQNAARAAENYDAAVKAEGAGEYAKARDGYLKVKTYVPDYKDTEARLKNLEEVLRAQQSLDGAPATDPKRDELMVEYASALQRRGELARAVDQLQKALDKNPTSALAHSALASVDFEAGLVKEAIEHASRSVETDPQGAEGYYCLAFLNRTQQVEGADPAKALDYAQKAASLSKPNEWKSHELLAACYHDAGDMDKAVGALKEAVRASGGLPRLAKKYEAWGGKPDAPTEKPADKPADAQPPADKPADAQPPADKPADAPPPADKPADKPADAPPADKPEFQAPSDKPADKPAEGGDKPSDPGMGGDKPGGGM